MTTKRPKFKTLHIVRKSEHKDGRDFRPCIWSVNLDHHKNTGRSLTPCIWSVNLAGHKDDRGLTPCIWSVNFAEPKCVLHMVRKLLVDHKDGQGITPCIWSVTLVLPQRWSRYNTLHMVRKSCFTTKTAKV